MGFWFEEEAKEWKQHINLSMNAWLIINEDMRNFYIDEEDQGSFSGFLNRVFQNFYETADATISLRYDQKIEELENFYKSNNFKGLDKGAIFAFIDTYTEQYKSSLIDKAQSYPNGDGKKFRINKDSLEILRNLEDDEYYDSVGKYLKAIFEEYVSKPTHEREQIFFSDTINIIKQAINDQRRLKITLATKSSVKGDITYNRTFYVAAYKIIQDYSKNFNYLIGYSKELRNGETLEEKQCCYRLSRIIKIDIQKSMGGKISQEKESELEDMINKKDPMFISGDILDIKVRFTKKGLESLKRQIHMRPRVYEVDENDKYLYTFHCTEVQAMNYFFKFGWDANILEPQELRDKFILRYERSFKSYQGMDKEEIFDSEKEPS